MRFFLASLFFLYGCSYSQEVSTQPLTYLYQLQNANYEYLHALSPKISVVDPVDSKLTAEQIDLLQTATKPNKVYAYLSIGEAEDYRDYWKNGNWSQNTPNFVMSANPEWPGAYTVKYWDAAWQAIVYSRVKELAERGFDGVYLDIVDGYVRDEVINAYGNAAGARQAMEDFVIGISTIGKAINPNFHIIPQNAVELLQKDGKANMRYINAIDGIGKESTFYADNEIASWSKGDVAFLKYALANKIFVLATDYPTSAENQQDFVDKALREGYIPFSGYRPLNNAGAPVNATITGRLSDQFVQMPN
jgi:cysteinyl-tRNA synthetase, unknown class